MQAGWLHAVYWATSRAAFGVKPALTKSPYLKATTQRNGPSRAGPSGREFHDQGDLATIDDHLARVLKLTVTLPSILDCTCPRPHSGSWGWRTNIPGSSIAVMSADMVFSSPPRMIGPRNG